MYHAFLQVNHTKSGFKTNLSQVSLLEGEPTTCWLENIPNLSLRFMIRLAEENVLISPGHHTN
jgi:hypothetical protein|tara:strand:+ start:242 stop:430 length:189 start_codon:yes stop_codon:yes gene_type:complete